MRNKKNSQDNSLERRANKLLSSIEKSGLGSLDNAESDFNSLKRGVIAKGYLFAFLSFANLAVLGAGMFFFFQDTKVNFYSTSYTAEIELINGLPQKTEGDVVMVKYQLPYNEKSQVFKYNKKTIEDI